MRQHTKMLALLLCSALTTQAQDTYWALDGNKVLNTTGPSVINSPLHSDFNYNADRSVIFNASAEALFTGGTSSFFTVSDLGQVLPIPNECKKYISLEIVPQPTPHGHYLRVREIDATPVTNNNLTTGFPIPGTYTYLHGAADAVYWGAVAAKLNSNGTRYIYHLNRPASSSTSTLNRYTISAAGVTNTTPTTLTTTLPAGGFLKMSPDGEAIGYINSSGNFVTYDIVNNTTTTYSTYSVGLFNTPQEIPAIECAIVSGNRRWFLGNNSEVGFVTEGSSTYTKISGASLKGTKSSLALGRDGQMYYAFNNSGVSAGAGDLFYFNPANATSGSDWINSNSFSVSGAKIATTHGSGSGLCYLFGNQVAGEDVNSATVPNLPPTFTVNGQNGGDLILCGQPGEIASLIFDGQIFGIFSGYDIAVQRLNEDEENVGDAWTTETDIIDGNPVVDLSTIPAFGGLNSYEGKIRITFTVKNACGQTISTSIIFRLVRAYNVVDFKMIGPEDCNSGSAACVSHSPVGSGLPGLATPADDGLQYRIENIAHVNGQNPGFVTGTMPPCADGWMGASSVGLAKANQTPYHTTVASTNGYEIIVDEFTNTGTFIQNIMHTYPTTLPLSYRFANRTSPRDYFEDDYATIISNDYYYRVTLIVNTNECGPFSKESYFRIIEGNEDCAEYFKPGKTTGVEHGMNIEKLHVFPNPATNSVNVSWSSSHSGTATLKLTNVMGQVVLEQQLPAKQGMNNGAINISQLASGMYHYVLVTEDDKFTGKLVKQ